MRLWSLSPDILDRRALVAGWREALLAQKVLRGETKGYTQHSQLIRFKAQPDPTAAITAYLHGLADAADRRGYRFDRTRIVAPPPGALPRIPVTTGQVAYELQWLRTKTSVRDPDWEARVLVGISVDTIPVHPVFCVVDGHIEDWERV